MVGSVEPLDIGVEGYSPGSLRVDRKCWNKFKLISDYAAGGAEAVPVSLCEEQRFGKVMLNLFRPHIRASGGVETIKTLYGMNLPV